MTKDWLPVRESSSYGFCGEGTECRNQCIILSFISYCQPNMLAVLKAFFTAQVCYQDLMIEQTVFRNGCGRIGRVHPAQQEIGLRIIHRQERRYSLMDAS